MAEGKEQRVRLQQAARDVFLGSPQGRRVLRHLAQITCGYKDAFAPGYPDVTAHNTGRQAVWRDLHRLLHVDEEYLMRVLQEQEKLETQELQ